jgi:hypothetical protein
MHASDWISIASAAIAAVAVVFSYVSYRRTQDDQRKAQARLITAWWTRVDENNQDAIAKDAESTVWPEETGYRIWVNNSSDDAVYECSVYADIQLTDDGLKELGNKRFTGRPYILILKEQLIIAVGTLPPKERLPYGLDRSIIRSVGTLTVEFRDAGGTEWRRTAGKLAKRPSGSEASQPKRLSQRSYRWLPWGRQAERPLGQSSDSSVQGGEISHTCDPPKLPN